MQSGACAGSARAPSTRSGAGAANGSATAGSEELVDALEGGAQAAVDVRVAGVETSA